MCPPSAAGHDGVHRRDGRREEEVRGGDRDGGGEVLKLVKFEHPRQTCVLRVTAGAAEAEREPVVVMEPTGTYGDAVRYQCHARGLPVHMMPPKHTHDFAEVLDGVPSMHDPKAATVLAQLQAIRPARAWEPESASVATCARGWTSGRRSRGRWRSTTVTWKRCWRGTGRSSGRMSTCTSSGRGWRC